MPLLCSKETLAWLFYSLSTSSLLLLLFLYFSSALLLNLLNFIGSYPLFQRNQNSYEYVFSDEEEEEEVVEEEEANNTYYYSGAAAKDQQQHLVADIIGGGESLVFVSTNTEFDNDFKEETAELQEEQLSEEEDSFASDDQFSVRASAGSEDDAHVVEEEDMPTTDADSADDLVPNRNGPTAPVTIRFQKGGLVGSDEYCSGQEAHISKKLENNKVISSIYGDEGRFLVLGPKSESRKLQAQEKDEEEEIFGDSCTVGSTSKSSSEWRSSIKDSTTEDPFSSSSRRSCQKWESYTVFQKYDEEMLFLDRISAQKLHETESLKSIQVHPRSFSDRIVHKFATANKTPAEIRRNPYHELEAAYVAQICLTWEALNWNYKNFERKRGARRDLDPGCPANIAQQFQQFQVLLQRYVENEPYEQGRRPEIYARMRLLAPKLLLVPEYRDCEDDEKDEESGSRISSAEFLTIMEDGIKTFMNFLKADKEKPCQIIIAFFRRNHRGSVDPALLHLMKKVNNKKKTRLKDLRRAGKCIRRRRLKLEEEMEIVMGLIDLKVVSRVLRMSELGEEQLHWCEEKMSKVRVLDGKLQRDSSPLFFPAH